MHSVRVSSKNQVTLPVEICRELKVRKGSRLFMEIKDGKIIITPEPDNYVEHYYSVAKGTYGNTVEEIDAYVKEERETWD
ncbi:MAG: AbrB/MazE/SpoVT family DNA-binding domain-containing protein [Firmicutes bacterium]|nr:AbrB/MazE/SpoVT family DNA-binding domain-containing protein [Bacillota bacterium]